MWPLDRPASEVLQLADTATIAWAVFDPAWYLRTYQEVAEDVADADPAALLDYYLLIGQRLGHAPNRLFDEAWHRRTYPTIATAIEAGDYASAFDAYCRRGCVDRSPHWLFDEMLYRTRYPDLTLAGLEASGAANGYDHFLRHGAAEGRIGNLLFDPSVYLNHFPATEAARIRSEGVFEHSLQRIDLGETELPTSIYFDPAWYKQRYPDVAAEILAGVWTSALHHYLCNDTPTEFDPLEEFSEAYYLQTGLRAVIEASDFRNGYDHFLRFGAAELRAPSPQIDLRWYSAQPAVHAALEHGDALHGFAHYLSIGKAAGMPTAPPHPDPAPRPPDPVRPMDAALLPIAGRFGFSFACSGEPLVSVIMTVRDGFATTMATIASLRSNLPEDVELVLVDRGSSDETRAIRDYVSGAHLPRFETDIGWAAAAGAGTRFATAPAVLFLAQDARLAPAAITRARARLDSDAAIGAVGGMVIGADGRIAQAGGILWNDGGLLDYQRGAPAVSPEANFVRSVDHCSLAFLLVRSALLAQLDGLDPDCAETGYAAADLCAQITTAGFRVVYDPSVVVFHAMPPTRSPPAEIFLRKHEALLATRLPPGSPLVLARHGGAPPPRLLFIEDTIPVRRTGSGFVRSNDIVKVIAELGYQVTVFPVNGNTQDPARVFGDMPDTAEVMHDRSLADFHSFLADRTTYYDTIWVARTHNLDRVRPALDALILGRTPMPLVVLDTEAVAPLREAEQARLADRPYDLDAQVRRALANAEICDVVAAVTEDEAAFLRARFADLPIAVIGHMIEPRPTLRAFANRSGILFVGAIHTMDSPNFDSLVWFVDEVLPLIEETLGWETRLTVAGYTAPDIDLSRFEHHPRITLRGMVADLEPLYSSHKVFVAPTRYAAGTPYKIFEAASRGVPIVATELLRRQLGWVDEAEILSAEADDPLSFATAVVALHQREDLWRSVREGAVRRLIRENGRRGFTEAVARVLAAAPLARSQPAASPDE